MPGQPVGAEASPLSVSSRPSSSLRPAVLVAVFVGGCVGGLARELISARWPAATGAFPWAVLGINVTGSFLLAALLTLLIRLRPPTTYVRPLLASGFCGAFTTFSAVMGSAALLLAHDRAWLGAAYLAASFAGGLLAAVAGWLSAAAAAGHFRASAEARS